MLQKRILIVIGIALIISLAGVHFAAGISDYRGGYYIQSDKITQSTDKCEVFRLEVHADDDGHSVSTNEAQGGTFDLRPICQGSGNYSVIIYAGCRDGASFTGVEESPYGNSIYAQCPRYWHEARRQYLYLTYACCPYDKPADSPLQDECDFIVGDIQDCPDVVNNDANKQAGWVFPITYAYQALDCHPEDDSSDPNTDAYKGPLEESATVLERCINDIDDDCDGIINELDDCEADANELICRDNLDDWKSPATNSEFTNQACCGNDDFDYGRIISNTACTADGWKSLPTEEEVGQILDAGDGQLVMNTSNIYRCQPQLTPRTFTLKLTKEKADAPVFYPHTTYKQFDIYEGFNKLGLLSHLTALDADAYTISTDDPEVRVIFSPATQDVEGRLTTLEADSQFPASISSSAAASSGVYAFYFPNAPESFETVSITKDVGLITKNEQTHDFACHESTPDINEEARIIRECVGDDINIVEGFSAGTSGERVETGFKTDTSLLLSDTFNDYKTLAKAGLIGQYQYKLDWLNGLTGTEDDQGVNISDINSKLIYDATGNINPTEGTIEFWIKPFWNSTTDTKERVFFNYQETPYSYLRISKPADGTIKCKIEVPAKTMPEGTMPEQPLKASMTGNLEAGRWYKITMNWNRSLLTCSLSDTDGLITQQITPGYQPRFPKASTFSLGMMPGNTDAVAEAVFDNLKIYRNFKPTAYYCTDDFQWREDLDDIKYKTACKVASGLKWTGNYCCGEPKDSPEYYNDNGITQAEMGGCWESQWMDWGGIPIETGADKGPVINYKGRFEGCTPNNEIKAIKDVFTNNSLVNDNLTCTVLANARSHKDFYCSLNGNWTPALNNSIKAIQGATMEENRILKSFPWQDLEAQQQECCAVNDCWNGSMCVYNQEEDATYRLFNGYRCLHGNWIRQSPKITWNRQNKGFCPDQSQCLVNPWGDSSKNNNPAEYFTIDTLKQPQCIQDKQHIKQYYCENGIWSTRTKLIALQLIELASARGDYELFCGGFDDVLTYIGYEAINRSGIVQTYLSGICNIGAIDRPCVNQFCAVKYADGVAFGTSLNIAVNDSTKGFVKFALGKNINLCSQAMNNDGDYDLCGENIYYNNNTKSIIKIPSGTLVQATTDQLLQNRNFEIQNRFAGIKSYIIPVFDDFGDEVVNTTSLFENIFLAKRGNRDFFAYLETSTYYNTPEGTQPTDYIGLIYNNLIIGDDPCGINHINQKTGAFEIGCLYAGNNLNFVGIYPRTQEKPTIKQLWRGLTSLLRIS